MKAKVVLKMELLLELLGMRFPMIGHALIAEPVRIALK
jgi:hypothetical protein